MIVHRIERLAKEMRDFSAKIWANKWNSTFKLHITVINVSVVSDFLGWQSTCHTLFYFLRHVTHGRRARTLASFLFCRFTFTRFFGIPFGRSVGSFRLRIDYRFGSFDSIRNWNNGRNWKVLFVSAVAVDEHLPFVCVVLLCLNLIRRLILSLFLGYITKLDYKYMKKLLSSKKLKHPPIPLVTGKYFSILIN